MTTPIRVSRVPMLLFVVACVCSVEAQDARIAVFDAYNHASTYDDIKAVVSGVLARYAFIASRDARRLEELLKQQLAELALTITGYLAFLEDS
jgi:hypothetical protein